MADAKMIGKAHILARLARFPDELKAEVEKQLDKEADDLVAAIQRAVPVRTGVLRSTVRKLPGPHPLSRLVVAGGPETTVKVRKGVSDKDFARAKASGGNHGEYDYFRAIEFGHLTEDGVAVPAQPFFYPTYRARKRGLKRRVGKAARDKLKTLFPE